MLKLHLKKSNLELVIANAVKIVTSRSDQNLFKGHFKVLE